MRAWARAARSSPSCGWMVIDRPSLAVVHRSRSGHAGARGAEGEGPGLAHLADLPGRAGDGALLLIDGEVIKGEPAGHGRAHRPGLDDSVVPGVPVGRAGLPAGVGRVAVNLQAVGPALLAGVLPARFWQLSRPDPATPWCEPDPAGAPLQLAAPAGGIVLPDAAGRTRPAAGRHPRGYGRSRQRPKAWMRPPPWRED